MVDARRGTVRIEIVPWLTEHFGKVDGGRLVLEAEVDGGTTLGDLLVSLRSAYPAVGDALVDFEVRRLFDHIEVVHNDTVVTARAALDERIEPGDSLMLLPACSGG